MASSHETKFFVVVFLRKIFVAEIAQVVERRPEKPGVPSASLGLGILLRPLPLKQG